VLNHGYICHRLWGHGSCVGTTLLPPPVRVLPLHASTGFEAFVNGVANMFADGIGTDEVGVLGGVIRGCECLDGGDRWFLVTREDIIVNLQLDNDFRRCLQWVECGNEGGPFLWHGG